MKKMLQGTALLLKRPAEKKKTIKNFSIPSQGFDKIHTVKMQCLN